MRDLPDFINALNSELERLDNFDRDSVYNAFEKFVINKDKLKIAIDLGIFQFDYIMFKSLFEDTLFENGISAILELYRVALKHNEQESNKLFVNSYPSIAKGLASRGQIVWTNGNEKLPERLDLFAKNAFQLIGDGIENSLKPYLEFLDGIFCISLSKPVVKKKLGVIVDNLLSNNEVFRSLYKTLFLDIYEKMKLTDKISKNMLQFL